MNLYSFRHPVKFLMKKLKIAESYYLALFIKIYYKKYKETFLTENMSKLLVCLKIEYLMNFPVHLLLQSITNQIFLKI